MKVQILGSGCDKCKKLAANVKQTAEQHNIPCDIEKVEDINKITEFGVMMTPALVVDGKVVSVGKVLSIDEIANFLKIPSCDCGGACEEKTPANPTTSCCEKPSRQKSPCGCDDTETTSCCRGGGKKLMTIILLVFVVTSIFFMVLKQMKSNDAPSLSPIETEQTISAPQNENALIVYYFHGNQRCFTCNQIEKLTKQAIESKYAKELADGSVIFKSVNIDESSNEHFIKDFQLATRSVVMQKNGKYEKFDAVWTHVRNPEKFAEYIQTGVAKRIK